MTLGSTLVPHWLWAVTEPARAASLFSLSQKCGRGIEAETFGG